MRVRVEEGAAPSFWGYWHTPRLSRLPQWNPVFEMPLTSLGVGLNFEGSSWKNYLMPLHKSWLWAHLRAQLVMNNFIDRYSNDITFLFSSYYALFDARMNEHFPAQNAGWLLCYAFWGNLLYSNFNFPDANLVRHVDRSWREYAMTWPVSDPDSVWLQSWYFSD